MSCLALGCFIETEEVSRRLHKTFHWLNGEGSYTLTSELARFHWGGSQGFKVSRLMGSVCVCLCVCVQGEGPLVCHDSSAGIKCGTLI